MSNKPKTNRFTQQSDAEAKQVYKLTYFDSKGKARTQEITGLLQMRATYGGIKVKHGHHVTIEVWQKLL